MKKIIYSFMSLLLMFGLFSCGSDDINENYVDLNSYEEDGFSITAVYKEKVYEVPCKLVNDSLVFLDGEFSQLYNEEIALLPDLARLVYKSDDGKSDVIKFYSDADELKTKSGLSFFNEEALGLSLEDSEILTKGSSVGAAGRCILYDDTNFKDRTVVFDTWLDSYPSVGHLKPYAGFNDKTSAIRVFNFLQPEVWYGPSYLPNYRVQGKNLRTCFIGYEHDNFRGKVLYCVATYSASANDWNPSSATHQDYKLKNLGWNDKITSTVFRIIEARNIGDWVHPHN